MVLIIATAGLIYELAMAAVASYVLGDSVTQFSIVIGVYLSALGLGAYLSRFIDRRLALAFVDVELTAALIGGLSAPGLFAAFTFTGSFHLILYATVLTVGTLVGLELPLLIRLLQKQLDLKELIAKSLTFDYAGALLGSLAFSLFLVPKLGLVHSSIVCGLLNAAVGLFSTWLLQSYAHADAPSLKRARVRAFAVIVLLVVALVSANRITELSETALYGARPSYAAQSRYQRVVLVPRAAHFELYLNGNLQFSSRDEHRYHEALVHPAMGSVRNPRRVLIGGGGDGLAIREVLKWNAVESVTLVDLDEKVTELASKHPALLKQNQRSLFDPRVRIVNADAMTWFAEDSGKYDVILLDFPDPSNFSIGKLYSRRFYAVARERLAPGGAIAVQSTSPLFARKAFWCVVSTLKSVGFFVKPYHVFVPSFSEWGYVLATHERRSTLPRLPSLQLKYLNDRTLETLFQLPKDMAPEPVRVNRLNNQALVSYYLEEWSRFSLL